MPRRNTVPPATVAGGKKKAAGVFKSLLTGKGRGKGAHPAATTTAPAAGGGSLLDSPAPLPAAGLRLSMKQVLEADRPNPVAFMGHLLHPLNTVSVAPAHLALESQC